jgi:hypothetical protein
MFYNFSSSALVFGLVGALLLYLLIIGVTYFKKIFPIGKLVGHALVNINGAPATTTAGIPPRRDHFPPLIDKPADHPAEQVAFYEDDFDESFLEMTDDEGGTTLLKEAERVVEEIQFVVNHIASHPANPDEVFTKIRAIVSRYRLFLETEYYDAINNFIVVTVERDCDLTLSEEDLAALWYAGAQAA